MRSFIHSETWNFLSFIIHLLFIPEPGTFFYLSCILNPGNFLSFILDPESWKRSFSFPESWMVSPGNQIVRETHVKYKNFELKKNCSFILFRFI